MATIEQVWRQAFLRWYTTAGHFTVSTVRGWLQGPRPQRLGVVTGRARNSVSMKLLADGFAVGSNVDYLMYWEKGIKAHKVTAVRAKVLAIPVGLAKGTTKKQAAGMGVLKTGRQKGVIFRKSVYIPAQAPRKWLEPGIKEARPQILFLWHLEMRPVVENFPDRIVGT